MKKIRLDERAYLEKGETCSITICTVNHLRLFNDDRFVDICALKLRQVATMYRLALAIYCFMPDHVHILLNNTSGTSIVDFVRDFKYKCTREAWKFGFKDSVFQKSFHDHFLRDVEEIKAKIDYIYENPIRKGLPESRMESPFIGSDLFDIK
jgi:putative transposase